MSSFGPSIVNGELRYLSVSQLEKYDPTVYGGCPRRWWFRYITGAKEPQKANQKLGTQCHSQNEHYLKTGEDVLGEVVRAGKRFLPRPGPDLLIEHEFGYLEEPAEVKSARAKVERGDLKLDPNGQVYDREGADTGWLIRPPTDIERVALAPPTAPITSSLVSAGVSFIGYIDVLHRRGEWVNDDGEVISEPGVAEAVDWKTTKQIDNDIDPDTGLMLSRGYAKSADELSKTWQMVGYGEVARVIWPDLTNVRLSHGYFQTQGVRAASKRSALVTVEDIKARWHGAESVVEKMKATARETDINKVEPNYAACKAFGGCPHRAICPRDPKLVLDELGLFKMTKRNKEEVPAMNLLERMKSKGNGAPPPAPKVVIAPTTEVAAEMAALEAEERAAGITPPDVPAPKDIAKPIPPEAVVSPAIRAAADAVAAGKVAGPCLASGTQRKLTTNEAVAKKGDCTCGAVLKFKPKEMGSDYYSLVPKHDTPGLLQIAEPAPAPAPEPTTKELLDAAVAKNIAATADVKFAPYVTKLEQHGDVIIAYTPETQTTPVTPPLTLYLDAVEDGVPARRLELFAEQACQALCEQYKAADVRCAPSDSPLGFGRWRGALAAVVRADPPTGPYTCSSSSEIGLVVFEALASQAFRVVRGVGR